MFRLLLVVASIYIISGASPSSFCPPSEDVQPCHCNHGTFYDVIGTKVTCEQISNPTQLKKIIQTLRGFSVQLLQLDSLNLPYLPRGLFSGTKVEMIQIISSHISSLAPSDQGSPSPFDGLDDCLKTLEIHYTDHLDKWQWTELQNLKSLRYIRIRNSPLHFVGRVFSTIGGRSLKNIDVSYCNVSRIHPQVFSPLTDLLSVSFQENLLPYMSRTMFPDPANNLSSIFLRKNLLFNLPEDMFTNMPALVFLDLRQNQLKSLPEAVYSPVWNNLQGFYFGENPLVCDCELVWLIKKMKEYKPSYNDLDFVYCTSPRKLRGRTLTDLREEELQC